MLGSQASLTRSRDASLAPFWRRFGTRGLRVLKQVGKLRRRVRGAAATATSSPCAGGHGGQSRCCHRRDRPIQAGITITLASPFRERSRFAKIGTAARDRRQPRDVPLCLGLSRMRSALLQPAAYALPRLLRARAANCNARGSFASVSGALGRAASPNYSSQSTDLRTYQPLSSRVGMYSVVQSSPVAPTALFDCAT
jgi:hypothetical protein